jgi:hypothetical protein
MVALVALWLLVLWSWTPILMIYLRAGVIL